MLNLTLGFNFVYCIESYASTYSKQLCISLISVVGLIGRFVQPRQHGDLNEEVSVYRLWMDLR